MSSRKWGELRTWLTDRKLDGKALSDIITPWHEDSPEELFEHVLPYLFDHMDRHPEQSVLLEHSVPYSPWIDRLLQDAFALDQDHAAPERTALAYRRILVIKPDCVPAHTNLYRVTHHGRALTELFEMHDWQVSGPHQESVRVVRSGLEVIDWVGRLSDTENDYCLDETIQGFGGHLLTRGRAHSTAFMAVQALLITLDHDLTAPVHIDMIARLFLSLLLNTMCEPYTLDDTQGGQHLEIFGWPVEKPWSFSDPLIVEGQSAHNQSFPDDPEHLHIESRAYRLDLDEAKHHEGSHHPCRLSFFPPHLFEHDGSNLIALALDQIVYQMIAAGLPVYRRLLARHGRQQVKMIEALVWHLGHMAAPEQAALRSRLNAHELRALSIL